MINVDRFGNKLTGSQQVLEEKNSSRVAQLKENASQEDNNFSAMNDNMAGYHN